jgi:hypothetical protein
MSMTCSGSRDARWRVSCDFRCVRAILISILAQYRVHTRFIFSLRNRLDHLSRVLVMLRSVVAAISGAAIGVGLSVGYKVTNCFY